MHHRILAAGLASLLSLALSPVPHAAPSTPQDPSAESQKDSKKKKKKKNKDKGNQKSASATPEERHNAKDAIPNASPPASNGDWCTWLANDPLTYTPPTNPLIQSFRLGGRFQYQAAYLDGSDVNGRNFHDSYDEYRRFRLETRTKFLKYLSAELDLNLVDDNRYRTPPANDLDWGYDDFDTATLEFNLGKLLTNVPLDSLKLTYGRMKIAISEEQRQSSRAIRTIERSLISDKLSGDEGRPTGFTIEAVKNDWTALLGVFSTEDDADFLGGWNDGETWFTSITWQPDGDFSLTLDHIVSQRDASEDDALGYRSATVLGSTYEKRHWGVQATAATGDNGYGDPTDSRRNRAKRQGDFGGLTVTPWYWIVKDRLQAVASYQYLESQNTEGIRLSTRYLRGQHDDLLVNINGGRGDRYEAFYLGLNYFFCGDNAKIMGAVTFEQLETPAGDLEGTTWLLAFRSYF